jgi:beta-phosphoglucomutase
MNLIDDYDLFLLDFDGLLVNTEQLHREAYNRMCLGRGFKLPWDFQRYCLAAHFESTGLRDQIYQEFPGLYEMEPDWSILYQEKKNAYMELLQEGAVQLMPGAEDFLLTLEDAKRKRCVVTHSPLEQIKNIRNQCPLLDSIPVWFTRENYSRPKPDPECYEFAIKEMANNEDRIIGFEDSPRGLKALKASQVKAVLITEIRYDNMDEILEGNTAHFTNLNDLLAQPLL